MNKKELLENKKNEYELILNSIKKINTTVSVLRFVCCFVVLGGVILGTNLKGTSQLISFIVAIVFALIFIIAVVIHRIVNKKFLKIRASYITICDLLDSYSGNWQHFVDTGEEFIESDKYFLRDLDILGDKSLYQLLCHSKTPYGRFYFAKSLSDPSNDLELRQDSVTELSNNIDLFTDINSDLLLFEYRNGNYNFNAIDKAITAVNKEVKVNKLSFIMAIIGSCLFVLTLILSVLEIINPIFLILIVILNMLSSFYLNSNIKEIQADLAKNGNLFDGYDKIFKTIYGKEFNSKLLKDYQSTIKEYGYKPIKSLANISGFISNLNNIFFNILGNGVCQISGFIGKAYQNFQKKYSKNLLLSIQALGHIEEYLSLSSVYYLKEEAIMPKLSDKLEFTDIKHPLLDENNFVGNDFTLKGMNIITGSNMSGKTTFMRSIGVNYVLFKAGTYVTAKSFKAGIYTIFTSMRANDDVNEGISTFYAEILRVKSIIEFSKKEEPMLVLIDEIFKGTNSADRIVGALATVNKLNKPFINGIITTHDYELCDIANAKNYHFLEYYENDLLKFDYKIKEGKATTTNAKYLMKLAGIIE